MRRPGTRSRLAAPLALVAFVSMLGVPLLVSAQTAQDPSNVVLVFDVSNSILLADDGTNVEFANALEGIAARVEASADELVLGNAEVSFVAFGRTAIAFPNGCEGLALNQNPAAVDRLATCLRRIADNYRAGADATVRDRLNTQDTDHVAALVEAADLLPDETTRSAVIFFTDGAHDPPGTTRDGEDVVAEIAAAYQGRSPLAILPVGLGAAAGNFETQLQSLYDAYFRDMEPCEGRGAFSWPDVVFPSADEAGVAVAEALQEVTCSFVFVPPATPTPVPTLGPSPSPTQPPIGVPLGVQMLAGNASLTVQWQAPPDGGDRVVDYLVRCRPDGGGDLDWIASGEGVSTETQTEIDGLEPGVAYTCEVAATDGVTAGEYAASAASVVVLGIPAAPGQPRAEPMNGGARLSVDPITSGAPAESYVYQCTSASGEVTTGTGPQPAVEVRGLVNGVSYTCVAFAENRIGRSTASVASAAFSPCADLFDCVPAARYGLIGGLVAAALVAVLYVARRYQRRNRVWVTAQVDGGENRALGWGPEIGVQLEREGDGDGMFARLRAYEEAAIKVRYRGEGRFVVSSKAGIHDVHQGDPAPVRDDSGFMHLLTLRRYRGKPNERQVAAARPGDKAPTEVAERLEGRDEQAAPSWDGAAGGSPDPVGPGLAADAAARAEADAASEAVAESQGTAAIAAPATEAPDAPPDAPPDHARRAPTS